MSEWLSIPSSSCLLRWRWKGERRKEMPSFGERSDLFLSYEDACAGMGAIQSGLGELLGIHDCSIPHLRCEWRMVYSYNTVRIQAGVDNGEAGFLSRK